MLDVTNTYRELERSGVVAAVLPVGAIEQHGPRLPSSVDWAQADVTPPPWAKRPVDSVAGSWL